MVSFWYDWLLFLSPPVLALLAGIFISGSTFTKEHFLFWDQKYTGAGLFLGIIIHAHLVAVFFRSHANKYIFQQHRLRFLLVPLCVWGLMNLSPWLLVTGSVVATFWDVYHSGAQTFGFARIYDSKAGNHPLEGRRLDFWINQLLYAGPILAGVSMMDHFGDFNEYKDVGDIFFLSIPPWMQSHHAYFTWAVVVGGSAFVVYYIYAYWRLAKLGHTISWIKIYLLSSTGVVSIYTWGFNSWGESFFIMNIFHAVQYFGIVWALEKRSIVSVFGLKKSSYAKPAALILFLLCTGAYGYWVQALNTDYTMLWSITLTVSLMHFWYDGFVWSVRKAEL
ncbi:MAG: hypothetical protein IPJ88_08090 [Myxococcales bacterium]|nr:MAG: hypothetical protein IPJ88_08090 [Myxococcales bacterium]